MSKRLQVLIPDNEYKELLKICQKELTTLAAWVRESLRESIQRHRPKDPQKKLATLLKFAKHNGPTGDIDQILSGIESGQNIKI